MGEGEKETMKTPEELAEEYAIDWHKDCDYPEAILKQTHAATMTTFLAGYKAAQEHAQLKNAAAYSHGSDVQKIASEYLKNKGIDGALLPYAENRFIDGYLVAKEHAHAALEEAEARHQEYVDKTEANFKELEAKIAELQAK
jgi:hypothetical protein